MSDRRQKRLKLLARLREMNVEQARSAHVAANAELDERRARAEDTQHRLESLDAWATEKMTRGEPLSPELLQQAQLYRGVEKRTLEQQRSEEEKQRELTETARRELRTRFEELSVVERLAQRHAGKVDHEHLRRGFLDLDEAGIRKSLEAKE